MTRYRYRRCCISLAFAFVCSTFAATISRADSVTYVISTNSCTALPLAQFYFINVTLNLTEPARYLHMQRPNLCGMTVNWNVPVSGPDHDLTVDLGACVSGSILLYSAVGNYSGPACCPMYFRGPYLGVGSDQSPPILIGCNNETRYVMPPCSTGVPALTGPAEGALVTQTPTVSWTHSLGSYCTGAIGVVVFRLYYGTDPANLDQLIRTTEDRTWTLPLLAPNTQYFWRVFADDDHSVYTGSQGSVSEVRSFNTSGPVATQPTTWGMIKSMYRD